MGYPAMLAVRNINQMCKNSNGGGSGYSGEGGPGCFILLIVVFVIIALIDGCFGATEPATVPETTVVSETAPEYENLVFSDVTPEHWCYDKIVRFEEKGYVKGYEDGTFRPNQEITRAEFIKIVDEFMGLEVNSTENGYFRDVSADDWFAPYVNAAFENNYIHGYEDGTFRPYNPIRRQEAIVILARIVGIAEAPLSLEDPRGLMRYSDSAEVEEWARQAVNNYSIYGFVNGYGDGTLRVFNNVTRAEVVELLNVVLEGM